MLSNTWNTEDEGQADEDGGLMIVTLFPAGIPVALLVPMNLRRESRFDGEFEAAFLPLDACLSPLLFITRGMHVCSLGVSVHGWI
ncbi:hypothetical protein F2Q69_00031450 [Brassica cretica]|uniref:Uncharacterized protein n=1 Tax=Brassica cretica TaxID=69181 RepID=A0A8S9S0K4_BRACR|nr:hypothetical protein F2Q69_00031450 [Brassica cretica]